ncbi:hypothetical protein SCP_1004260 [Sparassis crispa]|uniref:Uncharacterized protein n=1 Tax=Sparassis crispa TaxID=139825 RepID=A0A401GYE2_9APHY|nr:hypothetical protein SCP_1004260 [Sparassis crispa]GBE87179.1 hypothetical protein SCP_1004260 [Sparassis crispa]
MADLPPMLAALAAAVPQESFVALQPILEELHHRISQISTEAATTQASILNATQMQNVSTAHFTVQAPPSPLQTSAPSIHPASIKADLPIFRGQDLDDVN